MKTKKEQPLGEVETFRIATDGGLSPVPENCAVAAETVLTVDVFGVGTYSMLCTPADRRALAVGFLFSEGIIEQLADIGLLAECPDSPDVLRVRLAREPVGEAATRNLLIVSSCGMCGDEALAERLAGLGRVNETLFLEPAAIRRAATAVGQRQELFRACGGTHAAALFDGEGRILALAEDIGRHNALDKAVGMLLLQGGSAAGCGVFLSGRLSFELVGKCTRAGIELLAAVSAPTLLAVQAAERSGITLLAFVRENRATVFTGSQRLRGWPAVVRGEFR